MMRNTKIERIAESLYDPQLPYHNFNHVREVLCAADEIITRCELENIKVDERVIYLALLFHDAGYRDDYSGKGFPSKEDYAAHLAGEKLRECGYDTSLINSVKQAILATHMHAKCKTNNDIAVRAADLSGLADRYDRFKMRSIDLMRERELLSGETISWDDYKHEVAAVLNLYLQDELRLTSDYYDENGESRFHSLARQNLARLMADSLD